MGSGKILECLRNTFLSAAFLDILIQSEKIESMAGNSKVRFLLTAGIFAILTIFPISAGAEGKGITRLLGKSDKPFHIRSERLKADNQSGILVFSGNVEVRQGNMILTADMIETRFDPDNRELCRIIAQGNVRMSQNDWIGVGEHADYDVAIDRVVMTGSPRIWQGEDQIEGKKIIFDLSRDRFEVHAAKARVGSARLKELQEKGPPGISAPPGKEQ